MSSPGRWIRGFLNGSMARRELIGRTGYGGLLVFTTSAALLGGAGAAYSGPCTAQIAHLEQQINLAAAGPAGGPTAPQSLGAQLHHQPTPRDVRHAEEVANTAADAALERARQADAAGNADDCNEALRQARRLYGIE